MMPYFNFNPSNLVIQSLADMNGAYVFLDTFFNEFYASLI
jgi:hypothetical protein